MLTKREIRANANRAGWLVLQYSFLGGIAGFIILGYIISHSIHPTYAFVSMMSAYGLCLGIGAWKAHRIKTICPLCKKNLGMYALRVRLTRRCTYCGEQIVEGKYVTDEVLKRHSRFQHQKFCWLAKVGLWACPVFSGFMLAATIGDMMQGDLFFFRVEINYKRVLAAVLLSPLGIIFSSIAFKQTKGRNELAVFWISTLTLCSAIILFFFISSMPQ